MSEQKETWPTRSVTFGPITAVFRRATTIDNQNRTRITGRLRPAIDDVEQVAQFQFARICVQMVSVTNLDWQPPDTLQTAEEIQASYDAFQELDGGLTQVWQNMVGLFTQASAFNDPNLVPDYLLTAEQKADPKSGRSDKPTGPA